MITIKQIDVVERESIQQSMMTKRKGKISVPFFHISNQEI